VGITFRALPEIKSPWRIGFLDPNFVPVFLPSYHVFLHLPEFDICVIDNYQRLALFHRFQRSFQISIMVLADHFSVEDILAINHEEVISRINNS